MLSVVNSSSGPSGVALDRRRTATRERLRREVQRHPGLSTAELTARTGLHENTVRAHLEALRDEGAVRRERADPTGRGRPAWRWRASDASQRAPYAALAVALAGALAGTVDAPNRAARSAGVDWGRRLIEDRGTHGADARTAVLEVMREQGFSPVDAPDGPIRLRACPLLAAAREATVVCAVHEGMIEGIARRLDDGARGTLVPFAEPDGACLLHLRASA